MGGKRRLSVRNHVGRVVDSSTTAFGGCAKATQNLDGDYVEEKERDSKA